MEAAHGSHKDFQSPVWSSSDHQRYVRPDRYSQLFPWIRYTSLEGCNLHDLNNSTLLPPQTHLIQSPEKSNSSSLILTSNAGMKRRNLTWETTSASWMRVYSFIVSAIQLWMYSKNVVNTESPKPLTINRQTHKRANDRWDQVFTQNNHVSFYLNKNFSFRKNCYALFNFHQLIFNVFPLLTNPERVLTYGQAVQLPDQLILVCN